MNNFMRKFVITAMCLLAAAPLCGCGAERSVSEVKRYSVFIGNTTDEPSKDNRILKSFRDELGYEFDFEYLDKGLEDRLDVMIATGDYPDLISGNSRLIGAGALLPLEDYITEKDTPNLYRHIEPIRKRISGGDGHIYIIPNYGRYYGEKRYSTYEGPAFWIQARVLEEAGFPGVKTLDEFFALVEDYVQKHPETDGMPTIGYEILTAVGKEYIMTSPPAYLAGSPNNGAVIVDEETTEANIYADSDFTRRYLDMVRVLNEKGLLDSESFIQSTDQYRAKIASGRVVAMFDQGWNFGTAETKLKERGAYDKTYIPLVPVFDEGIEPWYMDDDVVNAGTGFGISVSCTDPKGLIEFMDAILSEDWQRYINWGVEGEDYLVDDEGRLYMTPEMRAARRDGQTAKRNQISAFGGLLPKMEGEFSDGNGTAPVYQPGEYDRSLADYERELYGHYGVSSIIGFLNPKRENPKYYPAWQIDLVDGSDADRANKAMTALEVDYFPRMMLAKSEAEFDSLWNEYTGRLRSEVDTEAYLKRVNEQIRWRMNNW